MLFHCFWFQYSFCSYSTFSFLLFLTINLFQYSFCSYSTSCYSSWAWNGFVSIQLLFLFNEKTLKSGKVAEGFQYSFCSYSTKAKCFTSQLLLRFQYSFCSYSTKSEDGMSSHNAVSIQLLFLFNEITIHKRSRRAKVSIQLLFLVNKTRSLYS